MKTTMFCTVTMKHPLLLRLAFLSCLLFGSVDSSFAVRHKKDVTAWKTNIAFGHQIWNTEKKWFFCVSPKTACSEWLMYIYAHTLSKRESKRRSVPSRLYNDTSYPELNLYKRDRIHRSRALHKAQKREIERISADPSYFRVAIARHPWDRLVSSFRSKIQGECGFNNECIRKLLGWAPPDEQQMTFSQFVEYLAGKRRSDRMNGHFALASDMCGLEYMNYTFVADLHEPKDLAYVSQKLGFPTSFAEYSSGPYVHDAPEHPELEGARESSAFPCTSKTVFNAMKYLENDARALGVNFEAALHSCSLYGMTSPPHES